MEVLTFLMGAAWSFPFVMLLCIGASVYWYTQKQNSINDTQEPLPTIPEHNTKSPPLPSPPTSRPWSETPKQVASPPPVATPAPPPVTVHTLPTTPPPPTSQPLPREIIRRLVWNKLDNTPYEQIAQEYSSVRMRLIQSIAQPYGHQYYAAVTAIVYATMAEWLDARNRKSPAPATPPKTDQKTPASDTPSKTALIIPSRSVRQQVEDNIYNYTYEEYKQNYANIQRNCLNELVERYGQNNQHQLAEIVDDVMQQRLREHYAPPVPVPPPPQPYGTFVQVKFRGSDKPYDYLIGNARNIHVGDTVYVWTSWKGKQRRKEVTIHRISRPGEVSQYARSYIEAEGNPCNVSHKCAIVTSPNGKKYHRPSCPHLRIQSVLDLTWWKSEKLARNSGFTPCGVCMHD